jgi:hypothetical protein
MYTSQILTETTFTGSSTWYDHVSLNFTPSDAGDTWLILATGEVGHSTGWPGDYEIRINQDGSPLNTTLTKLSEEWSSFMIFDTATLTASPHTFKLQGYVGASGNIIKFRKCRITAIKLSGWWSLDGASTTQTYNSGGNAKRASVQFTPPSTGEYLILGNTWCYPSSADGCKQYARLWKDIISPFSSSVLEEYLIRYYSSLTASHYGFVKIVELDGGTEVKLSTGANVDGCSGQVVGYTRIFVIRLDTWVEYDTVESLSESTTTSGTAQDKINTSLSLNSDSVLTFYSARLKHGSSPFSDRTRGKALFDGGEVFFPWIQSSGKLERQDASLVGHLQADFSGSKPVAIQYYASQGTARIQDAKIYALSFDSIGPATSDLSAVPSPTGGITTVTLTGTVSDAAFGGSDIAGAEWWEGGDPGEGNGNAMSPVDGNFDEVIESITDTIDVTGWSLGIHTIFVRGQDEYGNWGSAQSVEINVTSPLIVHIFGRAVTSGPIIGEKA